jgi:formylglycine-generating enzyme required for sulfatase activity
VKFNANGTIAEKSPRQAEYFEEDLGGGVKLTMVKIPGDTFQMGTADAMVAQLTAEQRRYCNDDNCRTAVAAAIKAETPQRAVTVPAFFIGKFEVTQAEWRAVAGMKKIKKDLPLDPSKFKDVQRPVDSVSWEDAVEFCARLSQKTGRRYRLPTEAEWEYACRSETTTDFAFGDTIFSDFINYDGNYPYGGGARGVFSASTRPVAWARVFLNGFGLSGMHGNVMEWCQDKWHGSYDGAPADASARTSNERPANADRVVRGGSWSDHASRCRSAFRTKLHPLSQPPTVGLRVVMDGA